LGGIFFDYRPLYEAEWLFFCFLSKTFFAFQCFSLLSAQVILSFARAKRWFAAAKRWFAPTKRWFARAKRKASLFFAAQSQLLTVPFLDFGKNCRCTLPTKAVCRRPAFRVSG
jgi:hypothetical protein